MKIDVFIYFFIILINVVFALLHLEVQEKFTCFRSFSFSQNPISLTGRHLIRGDSCDLECGKLNLWNFIYVTK